MAPAFQVQLQFYHFISYQNFQIKKNLKKLTGTGKEENLYKEEKLVYVKLY